jgi:hypothetical protein
MRPTQSEGKISDGDELLVDLRNCYVGLSAELQSRFGNLLRMSSEDLENLLCLVGQAVYKTNHKLQKIRSV